MSDKLHPEIIKHMPHLRAFALMLTRERTLADDLVQETVVRALSHADQFQPGSNFKAWISTILRNSFFNELRHRGRVTQLNLGVTHDEPTTSGGQEENLDVRDFGRAFKTLSAVHREALVLVGASGFSYEEAANIANCAVGTMKSRVSRARIQLQEILNPDQPAAIEVRPDARDESAGARKSRSPVPAERRPATTEARRSEAY